MQAEYDAQLAAQKLVIETFIAAADKVARDGLAADSPPPEKWETLYPEATQAELAKLKEQLAADGMGRAS